MGIRLFISMIVMIWLAVSIVSAQQKGQFEYQHYQRNIWRRVIHSISRRNWS